MTVSQDIPTLQYNAPNSRIRSLTSKQDLEGGALCTIKLYLDTFS